MKSFLIASLLGVAGAQVQLGSTGPITSCTIDKTFTWPDIPECDSAVDEFDGLEYYPSIVFQLEKRLADGGKIVVDHSVMIGPCNSDGVDGTTNSIVWNAPDKLPAAWNLAGAEADKDSKKFSLNAHFLTPNGVTFKAFDFTFNAACEFEATPDPAPKVCTTNCSGALARCTDGVCNCGPHAAAEKLGDDGVCPEPKPVTKPADANQDCQLGKWFVIDACSNPCGPGKKTRQRLIAAPAKGSGKACPEANCKHADLESQDICVEEQIDCDGKVDNPEMDCSAASMEGKLGAKCRAAEPKCDDGLECLVGGHPGLGDVMHCVAKNDNAGKKDQACRVVGEKCDKGLICDSNAKKCVEEPKKCFGCPCDGTTCEQGLICTKGVCAKTDRPACSDGSEGCKCRDSAPPCDENLECSDSKCRGKGAAVVTTTCDANACAALTDCGGCRESATKTGKPCKWCVGADGKGVCAPTGPQCQLCPAKTTEKSLSEACEAAEQNGTSSPTEMPSDNAAAMKCSAFIVAVAFAALMN